MDSRTVTGRFTGRGTPASMLGVVTLAVLLLASVSLANRAEDVGSIEGLYLCEGINPDGQPYTAMLELVQHEDHLHARWTFPLGSPAHGIGLIRQGVLAISYFGPETAGLVIYRIEDGAITSGEWVAQGANGVHREFVTKLRGDPPTIEPVRPRGLRVSAVQPGMIV